MRNQKPRFIRRHGRIIPIGVRREAGAVVGIKKEIRKNPSYLGAPLLKAGAALGAGLGLAFGAGRLAKIASTISNAKNAGYADRASKIVDFGGKAGVGLVAGSQLRAFDMRTRADEKSRVMNAGSVGISPLGIATGLVGGYGYYRLQKRFTHWGKVGGKFPFKLKGI